MTTARTGRGPRHEAGAGPRTLSVDIGGTGVKMVILDGRGRPLTERARALTPKPATPRAVLRTVRELGAQQPAFDRVSLGFPGVVFDGVTQTAPNLDDASWRGFDLGAALKKMLRVPVRVINDADMQGLGCIEGRGVEMLLTLGTGVGAGLYVDGRLVPNLELGHHPFRKGKTYEDYLGRPALDAVGKKKWRKRVLRVVEQLEPIFNYRVLYLGGGNSKFLEAGPLPANVRIVANAAGLLGGIALWRDVDAPIAAAAGAAPSKAVASGGASRAPSSVAASGAASIAGASGARSRAAAPGTGARARSIAAALGAAPSRAAASAGRA